MCVCGNKSAKTAERTMPDIPKIYYRQMRRPARPTWFRLEMSTLRNMLLNTLMGTLKSQSNGALYSNTVTGTLAVDGWTVTFGTVKRGLGGLLTVPNVTTHSTSYYSIWHYHCLCTLKG